MVGWCLHQLAERVAAVRRPPDATVAGQLPEVVGDSDTEVGLTRLDRRRLEQVDHSRALHTRMGANDLEQARPKSVLRPAYRARQRLAVYGHHLQPGPRRPRFEEQLAQDLSLALVISQFAVHLANRSPTQCHA